MMHQVARSSGAMSACSAIHINIYGPHPNVVFGADEQKARWVPDLVQGRVKSCFGVTEPDAGLHTTRIKTRAEKRAEERRVGKGGDRMCRSRGTACHTKKNTQKQGHRYEG